MEQQYTTLTKDINNIDNKDAIVYAYIKSRMNYKTFIADNITEKEISEKLGISLSTVKRLSLIHIYKCGDTQPCQFSKKGRCLGRRSFFKGSSSGV